MILGRAIKNEHLALGTLLTAIGGSILLSRGGSKSEVPQTMQQAKASIPIKASSKCVSPYTLVSWV
jgi:F-type H+-transporting ATPase subunit k